MTTPYASLLHVDIRMLGVNAHAFFAPKSHPAYLDAKAPPQCQSSRIPGLSSHVFLSYILYEKLVDHETLNSCPCLHEGSQF